jgi:hypothetical protein
VADESVKAIFATDKVDAMGLFGFGKCKDSPPDRRSEAQHDRREREREKRAVNRAIGDAFYAKRGKSPDWRKEIDKK